MIRKDRIVIIQRISYIKIISLIIIIKLTIPISLTSHGQTKVFLKFQIHLLITKSGRARPPSFFQINEGFIDIGKCDCSRYHNFVKYFEFTRDRSPYDGKSRISSVISNQNISKMGHFYTLSETSKQVNLLIY